MSKKKNGAIVGPEKEQKNNMRSLGEKEKIARRCINEKSLL